jgi:ribosomal protein L17
MKIIEAFINEKEDFVVDFDLKNMYCVYQTPYSSKSKDKYFKTEDEAEKYAKKKLSSLRSAKGTNTPKSVKEVVVSKGDKIINKYKVVESVSEGKIKYTEKQKKAAQSAIKSLIFKHDEAEIASNQFSYVQTTNDRMAEIMSEVDPKYDYEVMSETESNKVMGKVTHYHLVRVEK